jgi:hypothetical protein
MRAPLVAACLLVLAGADAARAATPPGAPRIGLARAADHRAHPDADREWWRIEVRSPSGRGIVTVEVLRERGAPQLRVDFHGDDEGPVLTYTREPLDRLAVGARSIHATGPRIALDLIRRGRRMVAAITLPDGARCRIKLAGTQRGPAARKFGLGRQRGDPGVDGRPVWLSWSLPVARARASARFVRAGRVLENGRGWFGSYEHGWGDIQLSYPEWQYWDEQVVHLRRATWVLFGLNRTETMTGPGARDAMWLGVLARVTPAGVRACRARIRRPRWEFPYEPGVVWPVVTRARCGRLHATFREGARLGLDLTDHKEAWALTRVGGRGVGWGWHAFH